MSELVVQVRAAQITVDLRPFLPKGLLFCAAQVLCAASGWKTCFHRQRHGTEIHDKPPIHFFKMSRF
jgi:hypothetical protein